MPDPAVYWRTPGLRFLQIRCLRRKRTCRCRTLEAALEKVEGARVGQVYTVFSEEELRDIRETFGWLKAAEKSFDFWNNPADAVYDTL